MNTKVRQRQCFCIVRHAVTHSERTAARNELEHKLDTLPPRLRHQKRLLLEYKLGPCPFVP